MLRFYSCFLSPFFVVLGARCRFYPSCSEYARIAIEKHGIIRGLKLSCMRLVKCQPWHGGGYDPVPEKEKLD